jgi:H+-transporting ATPase
MTDFVKISLATDNERWSRKPDTWNITGLVKISVILSLLIIAESFGLLYVGFNYFHLAPSDEALYTFTFEILFYSAMFLIFNVREREHFWNSMPSKTLLTSIILSMVAATIVSTVGIPGLTALPLTETLFVIFYSLTSSLILNDLVKFILVKKTGLRW